MVFFSIVSSLCFYFILFVYLTLISLFLLEGYRFLIRSFINFIMPFVIGFIRKLCPNFFIYLLSCFSFFKSRPSFRFFSVLTFLWSARNNWLFAFTTSSIIMTMFVGVSSQLVTFSVATTVVVGVVLGAKYCSRCCLSPEEPDDGRDEFGFDNRELSKPPGEFDVDRYLGTTPVRRIEEPRHGSSDFNLAYNINFDEYEGIARLFIIKAEGEAAEEVPASEDSDIVASELLADPDPLWYWLPQPWVHADPSDESIPYDAWPTNNSVVIKTIMYEELDSFVEEYGYLPRKTPDEVTLSPDDIAYFSEQFKLIVNAYFNKNDPICKGDFATSWEAAVVATADPNTSRSDFELLREQLWSDFNRTYLAPFLQKKLYEDVSYGRNEEWEGWDYDMFLKFTKWVGEGYPLRENGSFIFQDVMLNQTFDFYHHVNAAPLDDGPDTLSEIVD